MKFNECGYDVRPLQLVLPPSSVEHEQVCVRERRVIKEIEVNKRQ